MIKQLLKKIVVFILTVEAYVVLKKYTPTIVAIIGSVGKTATKDAVAAVLEKQFYVRKSEKSSNSDIGVPLTILGCENAWRDVSRWARVFLEGLALIFLRNHYPKVLVLEVGADRPGDIERLARWIKPDVVLVTRFGKTPAHVEFFKSREALVEEKKYMVRALKKDGKLIINADDDDARAMGQTGDVVTTTFAVSNDAILKASNIEILYDVSGKPKGIQCKVLYRGAIFPLKILGTVGEQYISVALGAFAVGVLFGINIVHILERLSEFKIPPGRFFLLEGKNGSVLIDDTYNASPIAVEAALRTLGNLLGKEGRKIAVLGDMLELGKWSVEEHKRIGSLAAHAVDTLISVGPRAKMIDEGAYDEGMKIDHIRHFADAVQAGKFLREIVTEKDTVLIKGSQGMRMERVVEAIMAEPEKKKEFLVRQEKEWLRR